MEPRTLNVRTTRGKRKAGELAPARLARERDERMLSASSPVSRRTSAAVLVCGAGLVAAVGLAWANSFHGAFVLDDMPAITENPTLHGLASAFSPPGDGQTVSGRPLVNLTFALNWALGGNHVFGFHVLNLAIHALAALALFGVARRTLLRHGYGGQVLPADSVALNSQLSALDSYSTLLAFAIAALWALHPLQTESVTYLSQRAESLAGLWLLVTLYAATRGAGCHLLNDKSPILRGNEKSDCHLIDDNRPGLVGAKAWHAIAVLACFLGMASKEIMYAAPLLVLLHDRTFFAGTFRAALSRRPGFYAALASTWFLLGWLVWHTGTRGSTAGFGLGISPWHYLLTQCGALVHYLRLAVWPTPLVLDYGFAVVKTPVDVCWQALVLLGAFAATIVGVVRRAPWSFLGAWFFLLLAPSSSVVPVATQTIAEHRMYLPLAAVVAAGVLGLRTVLGRRGVLVFTLLALALGALTAHRNSDYRTALGLWQDTIAKRPGNARAFSELANNLYLAGRLPESLAAYERALQLTADFPKARHNYANALVAAGRLDEAAAQLEIAITQSPGLADAYYSLANVRREQGRNAEAIACYEAALKLRPAFAAAHNNLANLLAAGGRIDDALAHFAAATRAQPDFPDAEYNWANVLAGAGRSAEAVPHYEAALRVAPNFVAAHENLGVVLLLLNHTPEGIRELETALRLDPSRESARRNLEIARARPGP